MLLFIDYEKVNKNKILQFKQLIYKRSKGEPTSYIVGFTEFMGLKIIVNKNVLIPRLETEILVEEALTIINAKNNINVLDLCTGSGCIAISIAKLSSNKKLNIIASDISLSALKIAKKNALLNDVNNINFIKSDIFDKINNFNTFDLIVTNPPYISMEEYKIIKHNLKHEPYIALVASKNGLFFYIKIAKKAKKYLKDGGIILIELNPYKFNKIKTIFLKNSYKDIEIINDYSGLPRILKAKKK
jgi:release factor glutamine methyltransferase